MAEKFLKPLTGAVKTHKFAVFDLETTVDLEKCYLVGFADGCEYRWFDVTDSNDSSVPFYPEHRTGPVAQFLSWYFATDKYCGYWCYAHNGGNFDLLYIVRWLLDHESDYTFEVVPLQSSILCLSVIEKRSRKKQRRWTFLDSYRLMNAGLDKIGNALFGEGKTTKKHVDGSPVGDTEAENNRFYAELNTNPLRYEYLEQDCRLLYRSLEKFYFTVEDVGGEIGMTAPSTAMKSFRRMHMQNWIPINKCFPECECSLQDKNKA